MQPIDIAYHLFRIWVGGYFLFWGLNGFFNWLQIPPNSAGFESFMGRLNAVPRLMTTVKVSEIASGVLLLYRKTAILGMIWLLPIVGVIVVSHLYLNFAKGWRVALAVLLPYLALVVAYSMRL